MAITSYGVNDAMAVKAWARELAYEVRKGLEIAPLIGKSASSIIQEKTEIKSAGDQVTFGLRMQLLGDGVSENQVLEGNEEALSIYSDSLVINEIVHGVRVKGEDTIDQQRVLHNLREEGRDALKDWFSERLSLSFFLQMCGYTAPTITYRARQVTILPVHRGLNDVRTPTNRILPAGVANEQSLGTTNTFTLRLLDIAKERALTANPKIRPIKIDGQDMYVCYLHPYQVTDLRTDATTAGSWFDIQKAALQGGERSNNPIFTGALGVYNGVVLRQNEDVTTGVHSTNNTELPNVRRALFMGAQAGGVAFSSKYSKTSPYKWVEEPFDYKRELGISVQGLWGLKKTQFRGADFGTLVIPTYAAAH